METTCEPNIPKRFTLTAGEEDTLKPSTSCMMGLDYNDLWQNPGVFWKDSGAPNFYSPTVGEIDHPEIQIAAPRSQQTTNPKSQ